MAVVVVVMVRDGDGGMVVMIMVRRFKLALQDGVKRRQDNK
jgi:hypothetical protein